MSKHKEKARVALITGVAGQDGVYLSRLLLQKGYRVIGLSRSLPANTFIEAYLQGVEIVTMDVADIESLTQLLEKTRPDELYNLAALSSVGESWKQAEAVAEVNAMSVLRMLELLVRMRDQCGWSPRFYQASSSEMFGLSVTQPQDEGMAHHPRSPYAAAKSFAHHLAINYRESYGLFVASGILFNHESPIRHERFVTRKISKAAAEIAIGKRRNVTLGNLDITRDWGAAEDYVEAMWLMLQQPKPDDFVIATGTSRRLTDVVQAALSAVGIEDIDPFVRSDPSLHRPADVPELRGDASKAARVLGWKPRLQFEAIIGQMVWADIHRLVTDEADSREFLDPWEVQQAAVGRLGS